VQDETYIHVSISDLKRNFTVQSRIANMTEVEEVWSEKLLFSYLKCLSAILHVDYK